ncbi:hypothetical protein ACEUAY_00400 [Aeromonas veronii]|uniref:hypothetical protein n=1 Tax=Aeromonas TaxID=642 RepID=UPI00111ACC63|nr:hypothetical protein [Aeromonas veronii]TNI15156.1 hypothetical protein CF106_02220 [Aeromonas veronii]
MTLTKEQIRAIESLVKSWHVAETVLKEDVMRAALSLGSTPNMSEAEMHFRRGAIWAAQNMLTLPAKLKLAAENQQAMESLLIKDDKKP